VKCPLCALPLSIKPVIKTADMSAQLQATVVELVSRAFDTASASSTANRERDIAADIRKELDKSEGRTWNVIIGKSFGADVTHETKKYCQVQFGELTILIWKSG